MMSPLVIVGGELTLDDADLQWSEAARFYEAPFQLKANGGTLSLTTWTQRVSRTSYLIAGLFHLRSALTT